MKKILNGMIACSALAVAMLGSTACSDAFLEDKRDFNNVSAAAYDSYEGARGRIDDLYSWCQPGGSKVANRNGMNLGSDDDMSKSTEEYAGMGKWVLPTNNINTVSGVGSPNDWFYIQHNNIQQSVWGRIRNVNDAIRGIADSKLSQEEKDELLGQAYFWRAWCYYMLVKWYGGVPIVKEVLDPIEGPGTPRSSARACFEFIFDDLDKAASMLEAATGHGGWQNAADYGRITTGTALALKGRLMNLWASPMFNRQNEEARWRAAFEFQRDALAKIDACGYGLVDAAERNAAGWADLFVRSDRNPEAVMLTIYNTNQGDGITRKNNGWEQSIRPENTNGGGGKRPSQMMVDLFPMRDGKLPAGCDAYDNLPKSEIAYDEQCPWMDRDPRFYRTFAFPGVRWVYSGTPTIGYYPAAADYTLWSYVWYLDSNRDKINDPRNSSSKGPDGNENKAKGFYVRKRSCDNDASAMNYVFEEGFARSATPWIEIRYAEVLLNYAEAAAGFGQTDVAVEQLRRLRRRVGYTGDCGIADAADKQTAMAAVLYERQIELAYEGKRFDDMRRWMLFDGGAVQCEGAPAGWAVTGWGGNTCQWLGFKQFNGQRRENYEFRVTYDASAKVAETDPELAAKLGPGIGLDRWNGDPLTDLGGIERPAGVDLRNELAPQLAELKRFYENYLTCKIISGDGYDGETGIDYTVLFHPHYYFLGLTGGAQDKNRDLPQTIGWGDNLKSGAPGTFDPLAEE